ncbi:hypothetical protein EDC04DRAFT_2609351 [Pisolithus marmoratus]|nr:hypothetical protein EDC04DRAFT_2609351 [Pisolithus marmoratus]
MAMHTMDNVVEADFHTDIQILPHKVTDVALMQLPDSPTELQPTFHKHFPLLHICSEPNLPHTQQQQRASHAPPNAAGSMTGMDAESSQLQPQTIPGTSPVDPGTGNNLTLHRIVWVTSRGQSYGWFTTAGPIPPTSPPPFQSDQPVEMGDLFIHHLNDSVSFWTCTRTQPLTWEPITIGDVWLLDPNHFLTMQETQPAWVLRESWERHKRHQKRSKDTNANGQGR